LAINRYRTNDAEVDQPAVSMGAIACLRHQPISLDNPSVCAHCAPVCRPSPHQTTRQKTWAVL